MLRRNFLAAPAAAFAQAKPQAFPTGVRRGHVMAWDSRRRELLLFGGLDPADPSGAEPLWILAGGRWRRAEGVGPRNRGLPAAAYDSKRGRFVVYGGLDGAWGNRYGDVWEWDGATWREFRGQGPGPGPRDHHAMAYDAARERVVLHGGSVIISVHTSSGENKTGSEVWYDETWEYDGAAWKPVAGAGPGTGGHHCMAYDPARKVTLLLGGIGQDRKQRPETWGWDGVAWRALAEDGPALRSRVRMAFHEPSGEMVLYGGNVPHSGSGFRVVGDTWVWNGKEWSERKPRDTPGPRFMHAMAYHAEAKRVILYGGLQDAKDRDDAWAWDGENWSRLP